MAERKQLTVGELISLLSECDPSLPVVTEGCDCTGEASGVETRTLEQSWDSVARRWRDEPSTEVEITRLS